MANVSMADLLNIYKKNDSPPDPILPNTRLSGKSVKEKLEKLYTARKNNANPPKIEITPTPHPPCLAICMVVVDAVPHEAIWRHWLENAGDYCSGQLYIHAKYPERIESPWLRERLLPTSFHPEWNSPEVIRALLALISCALENPQTARILLATESCLPLYDINYICEQVLSRDSSWLQARHTADSNWERVHCFQAVDSRVVPLQAVWKAIPGWILLTRRHAMEISSLPGALDYDLVSAWGPSGTWTETTGGVFAPEEVYFPTCLSLLGYLKDPPASSTSSSTSASTEVYFQMVTYARWRKHGDANPETFYKFDECELTTMRESGALFGRKFAASSCSLSHWTTLVEGARSGANVHSSSSLHVDREDKSQRVYSYHSSSRRRRSRSRSRERGYSTPNPSFNPNPSPNPNPCSRSRHLDSHSYNYSSKYDEPYRGSSSQDRNRIDRRGYNDR